LFKERRVEFEPEKTGMKEAQLALLYMFFFPLVLTVTYFCRLVLASVQILLIQLYFIFYFVLTG